MGIAPGLVHWLPFNTLLRDVAAWITAEVPVTTDHCVTMIDFPPEAIVTDVAVAATLPGFCARSFTTLRIKANLSFERADVFTAVEEAATPVANPIRTIATMKMPSMTSMRELPRLERSMYPIRFIVSPGR